MVPQAYEAYLKGRYYWNRRTEPALRKALGQFQTAIDLDPTYAPTHVGVADCYNVLSFYTSLPPRVSEVMPKELAIMRLPSIAGCPREVFCASRAPRGQDGLGTRDPSPEKAAEHTC